jgi:uncharacterized protein YbjQ (UPF0145 family)
MNDLPGYEITEVVGEVRFDTSEMAGNRTEICAYGTAVKAVKR